MNGKDGGAKGWVDENKMLAAKATITCWRKVHGQRNKIKSCCSKTCTQVTTMASKPWILKLQTELPNYYNLCPWSSKLQRVIMNKPKRKRKNKWTNYEQFGRLWNLSKHLYSRRRKELDFWKLNIDNLSQPLCSTPLLKSLLTPQNLSLSLQWSPLVSKGIVTQAKSWWVKIGFWCIDSSKDARKMLQEFDHQAEAQFKKLVAKLNLKELELQELE